MKYVMLIEVPNLIMLCLKRSVFLFLLLLGNSFSVYAQCCANGPNLLEGYNPDFSDPIPSRGVPPGFQTDNAFNNNQAGAGYYLISTSRNYGACSRTPQYDHTSGDSQGKFLWFDTPGGASPTNPAVAWKPYDPSKPAGTENLIEVTPHTDYVFSVWIRDIARNTDCVSGGAPVMGLRINGVDLAEIDLGTYTSPCCPEWVFLCCPWNSGDSVMARIQVESRSSQGFTDLAIDDVYFGTSTLPDVHGILGNDTTLCGGDTLTLHSPFPNTVWNDTYTGSSFKITSPGTYWMHVDDNNCHGDDSIVVSVGTVPEPFSLGRDTVMCNDINLVLKPQPIPTSGRYLWSDNSTGRDLTINSAGLYWLTVENGCGSVSDSIYVSKAMEDLSSYLTIIKSCINEPNGGAYIPIPSTDTNNYHFTWTDTNGKVLSVTDSLRNVYGGDYFLNIRSDICDTTLAFTIDQFEDEVSFTTDTLVCEDEIIFFQNTSDAYFTDFLWYFGDGDSSSDKSPSHIYEAGNYIIHLIGKGQNCIDTATGRIEVEHNADSILILKSKDSICLGEAITFTLSDATINDLIWDFGDGNTLSTKKLTIQHAYDQTGIMAISVMTTQKVCPDLITFDTVVVHSLPHVDLGPHTAICLNDNPITLFNLNPHIAGYKYLWNTGDTTQQLSIKHPGDYHLTVTSSRGCSSSESVKVNKDCYIDIPNAFTPNGDGSNDYFFPRQLLSSGIKRFNMSIYNRWGEKVFETSNAQGRGWDGKFNGKDLPLGVYVYLIEVETNAAIIEKYEGNVTLIR